MSNWNIHDIFLIHSTDSRIFTILGTINYRRIFVSFRKHILHAKVQKDEITNVIYTIPIGLVNSILIFFTDSFIMDLEL
jgi:hypothetical protein